MVNDDHKALDFDLFFKKDLVFRQAAWKDSGELFKQLSMILEREGYVAPSFCAAITRRELDYPTGLQTVSTGAAIPHTDPVHVRKPFIAVVRPAEAIDFAPMGGSAGDPKIKASIIFVLGVMRNGLQVQLLQKLMSLLANEALMRELLSASTDERVLQLIRHSFQSEPAV